MVRKLVISLFIMVVGASSMVLRAVDVPNQSVDCLAAAPAAPPSSVSVGIKSDGLPNIGSGTVNLVPGEPATHVTARAGKATCIAAFQKNAATCTRALPAAACSGFACCDAFDFVCVGGTAPPGTVCTGNPAACTGGGTCTTVTVDFTCTGIGTQGFEMTRAIGSPTILSVGSIPFGVGSVSHVTAAGVAYPIAIDIAPRGLVQVKANGVTGNITLRVTRPGPVVSTATVAVTSSNNDPGEAQALHNAISAGFASVSPALPTPLITVTHPLTDAIYPLTAFGFLKQASHFTEITNLDAAGVTKVEVVVQPGQDVTVEGSSNSTDPTGSIPTLNTWGIVVLVVMLLLAGYVLKRRQKAGTATI